MRTLISDEHALDWYQTLFEMIDMRSFSNLWFWIALAVMWSTASHWVLGVPFDMVLRARRHGGEAQTDLEDIVRINVNRMLYISQVSGLWLLGLGFFALSTLVLLGFAYDIEFAQALLLLGFPMSLVGLLSLSTARLIRMEGSSGDVLQRRLMRHRLYTQIIGMVAIFVTALWGMYQNLNLGPLAG
ncbi:hypothetical protein DSM110093_01452 [Sulfitobacter sp. DSM 110093]|nr:hypothetical protein DSM110093_01452 [Sulfitobacter sp. DSM 110093]